MKKKNNCDLFLLFWLFMMAVALLGLLFAWSNGGYYGY